MPIIFTFLVIGCARHDEHYLTYPWDDRGILCSVPMDDLKDNVRWEQIDEQMSLAELTDSVLTVHAHIPGTTISIAAIERLLGMAEEHNLAFVTYRDLAAPHAKARPGFAFAFDDDTISAWFSVRDLLLAHNARVTFFVTRFAVASDSDRAQLHTLFTDGHDVEPHSVLHLLAPQYVQDHGVAAYLADEFQPSIDVLVAAGYPPPAAYAYPFGRDTPELDAAILKVVPHVRVSPGACPY